MTVFVSCKGIMPPIRTNKQEVAFRVYTYGFSIKLENI
jgi:hypothetical protein